MCSYQVIVLQSTLVLSGFIFQVFRVGVIHQKQWISDLIISIKKAISQVYTHGAVQISRIPEIIINVI